MAWLCLVAPLATAAAVSECGTDAFASRIAVGAQQPTLVLVWQQGADLKIDLHNNSTSAPVTVNAPLNRYGPEFVLLPAQLEPTEFLLCVDSAVPDPLSMLSLADLVVERVDLSLPGRWSHLVDSIDLLAAATAHWSSGDARSRKRAAASYANAADRLEQAGGQLPQWAGYVRLYAALANAYLYDFVTAKQHLQVITERDGFGLPDHTPVLLQASLQIYDKSRRSEVQALLLKAIATTSQAYAGDLSALHLLLGQSYLEQGDIDLGERHLHSSLELAGADRMQLARTYNNLGYLYIRRSERSAAVPQKTALLRESVGLHQVALEHASAVQNHKMSALILNNTASIHYRLGELHQARDLLRESLRVTGDSGGVRENTLAYINLGRIYRRTGDYLKAQAFLDEAMNTAASGEQYRMASVECELGSLQRDLGEFAAAYASHQGCHAKAESADDHRLLTAATVELAQDAYATKQWGVARDHLRSAQALLADEGAERWIRGDTGVTETRLFSLLALVTQKLGEGALARQSIEAALGRAPDLLDPLLSIELLHNAMFFEQAAGRVDLALGHGQAAIAQIEQFRMHLELERLGPAWSAKTHAVFDLQLELLVTQQPANDSDYAQIFSTLERSRAIALRQKRHSARGLEPLAQRQANLTQLSDLARQRALTADTQQSAVVAQYHAHDVYLAEQQSEQVNTVLEPLTLAAAQAALGEGVTVLYYALLADDVVLLRLERDHVELMTLGATAQLNALLADFLPTIERSRTPNAQALVRLSDFLLPEFAQDTEELLVVAHRGLHGMPFALLQLPNGDALIDRFALASVPSLSAGFAQAAAPAPNQLDLAIIADPSFGDDDAQAGLMLANTEPSGDGLRSWAQTLTRLPWSALEASKLQGLFPDKRVSSFMGSQANRANLLQEPVRSAQILHIASHGYFTASNPDNTGIILAAAAESVDPAAGGEFLTLTEIMSYPFSNQLVVVSGCETGLGQALAGEGQASVSRAFLAQGAEHVVATLWPVSDRASAAFMELLYQQLRATKNIKTALRRAQQAMKGKPEYSNPFYWAPYVLSSATNTYAIDL